MDDAYEVEEKGRAISCHCCQAPQLVAKTHIHLPEGNERRFMSTYSRYPFAGEMIASQAKCRFLGALFGGRVDRTPVGNPVSSVTVELMRETGAFFPQAHLDPEIMAALAAGVHTVLGHDAVMPAFSVVQESAGLGCEIDWGDGNTMPTVRGHPFSCVDRPALPASWLEHPGPSTVLEAIGILRRELGHRVAIIGKAFGPWTLAYNTVGLEEFLMDTLDNPSRVRRLLETLMDVTIHFGIEQFKAGADALCIADHTTGSLVRAAMYRDFLLEIHQEINRAVGGPTILHCCGPTLDRLEYFSQAGFDAYHFESANDPRKAREVVRGRMSLAGNLNNPTLLLGGSPDDVYRESLRLIDIGVEILAPECAVPLGAPNANLRAMVRASIDAAKRRPESTT